MDNNKPSKKLSSPKCKKCKCNCNEDPVRILSPINFIKDNNIIRLFSNNLNPTFKKIFGYYYVTIHFILGFSCLIVLLFSENLLYLTILLLVVSLDSFAIVVLHDCPLTMLEEKYLSYSMKKFYNSNLIKSKIQYKCDHLYESQLEILINAWTITVLKIFCVMLCRRVKL